ncbi:hypothetical protein [Salinarimonas ramus]|uniref:Uncharacterized protein n=1 Tax=Salinarimonas ramus TaxID=690164 RepID=A0A917QCM2_9HYPH|nr:hypothetical protein [Salinarimonas ramus]GGK44152.1 hypothetical protein GCM10011322_34110 [Salinarimonas ramus]
MPKFRTPDRFPLHDIGSREDLRRVMRERMDGEFISGDEMDERLNAMIEARRRAYRISSSDIGRKKSSGTLKRPR